MTKKKNILSRIFFSNYFFPLIMILAAILGSSLFKSYSENKSIDSDLESLKKEIESLEKNNQDLGQLIEYFNSSFFVEKEAREKMGLKKDGETVLVLEDGVKYEGSGALNIEELKSEHSASAEKFLPKIWWNYFFIKN